MISALKNTRRFGFVIVMMEFCILATSAFSQTKWFKYEGNPVLDLGPKGAWDDEWIGIDRVILRDSTYRMWYSGGWKTARIGHATSRDGVTWKKDKSNPVLDVRPGSWESNVSGGKVILSGSKYHMWYTGDNLANFRIGYASSKDGIVWKKNTRNPVLDIGPPGSWDEGFSGFASVIGPDAFGEFKLWYQGKGYKIGYATAKNETTWAKYPDPVFWGNDVAWSPRVIFSGNLYEMWCGLRDPTAVRRVSVYPQPGVFGYVTSPDGVHWTESPENPVLRPGPDGSWDDAGLVVGDIIFDGQLYHMWYNGDDGTNKQRSGYAISPKGLKVFFSASNGHVKLGTETVRVSARVNTPQGLSFLARIRSNPGTQNPEFPIELLGMRQEALVELMDDGNHGDSLAGDGLFANSWTPTEEKLYFVDLKLRLKQKGMHGFEMSKAAVFTTIGPIQCADVEFLADPTPNPGDTALVKLTLRNRGSNTPARSVSASLSSQDPSIMSITESSPTYGDILPGKTATTLGYYRVLVNPYSSFETEAKINVSISSWGIPLWYDTFTITVVPPWWRTTWAYVLYLVFFMGSVGGTVRYIEIRKLRRKIDLLQRERALERERSRISQDMHDEIGATLTEISILSEMAKRKPDEASTHIQQISERSAEVIDNIGEIIWALNPRNDTLDNFVAYIRRYSVKYLNLARIGCQFIAPENIPANSLTTEVRRNLFLVMKEALHNVVKHSEATEVSISVSFIEDKLAISVVDNGRGFVLNERLGSGNGLENMKKRIADIGGVYDIGSVTNNGTRVSIEVTLKNIT